MTSEQGQTKVRFLKELAPWALGVLIVVIGIGTVKQALKRYEIQSEINTMQRSVSDLQSKNGQLLQLLSYVKSTAYAEEQARLQFGFAKPGEHLAVIPEGIVLGENTAASTSGSLSPAAGNPKNNWRWWSYFFPSTP